MKKKLMYLCSLAFLVMLASCSSDSDEDLTPPNDDLVTYDGNISALIGGSCLGCHSSPTQNGAPFSLTNFTEVSSRAGGILTAISRQTSEARSMPPAGRLPQSAIDLVEQWIEDGTLEN